MATFTGRQTIYDYLKNEDIPDGYHTLDVNGELIDIEIYNFLDDINYFEQPVLGDDAPDERMLILKYHKNLTVNKKIVVTPQVRKKGMTIYVEGTLINNGTISMTARGAIAEGQNVYLYQNKDGTFEYVPAIGGLGGQATAGGANSHGFKGEGGTIRGTGGGGSGANWGTNSAPSGRGGRGTSYSGGTGGGGVYHASSRGTHNGEAGSDIGGSGGRGSAKGVNTGAYGCGGVGNNAGRSGWSTNSSTGFGNVDNPYAENGTGGLLIIFAENIVNNGVIESKGSGIKVNHRHASNHTRISTGGCSGGGSVNLFYKYKYESNGMINVRGGTTVINVTFDWIGLGGDGGIGSVTIQNITDDSKIPILENGLIEAYNVENLEIGRAIRCNYSGVANQVGVFSKLGKSNSEFIPITSTNVPNGDFYFIMVDRDMKGNPILVADRNIQYGITWDNLNNEGLVTGIEMDMPRFNGIKLDYGLKEEWQINKDLTISTKFKFDNIRQNYQAIVAQTVNGDTLDTNWLYGIFIDSNGNLMFGHEYGEGVNEEFTPIQLEPKKTYHVVLVRDDFVKKYYLYLNGEFKGEYEYTKVEKSLINHYTTLGIGYDQSVVSREFIGNIDHVCIWDKACSQNEIDTIFDGKYDKVTDGLVFVEDFKNIGLGENYKATIRLMTGGINASNLDSEWQKYIVESNLNGQIVAGDDKIWNWSHRWSWTSTVNTAGNDRRTVRGRNSSNGSGNDVSNSTNATNTGFRPMLIIEPITHDKILIESNKNIYTYNESTSLWQQVSTLFTVTVDDFKQHGMDKIDHIPQSAWAELNNIFEVLTWRNRNVHPTLSVTTDVHKPIDRLQKPVKLITYADDKEDVYVKMDLVVEDRIRYLVSKDKRKTWWTFKDDTWEKVAIDEIHDKGMTKIQLEAITPEQWKQWFKRDQLDFAIGLWSNNPVEKPVVKSITVNFPANAAPIVRDFKVTPSDVFRDNLIATATITDLEGDPIQYRILINDKPYTNLTNDGWTTLTSPETTVEMSEIIDYKLLKSGLNTIKLIVRDDRGITYEVPYINVNLINTAPYSVSISNDNWSFNAQINDAESDKIQYRVLINGAQVYPKTDDPTKATFTPLMDVPANISYNWTSEDLVYGKEDNEVTVEVIDELGAKFSHTISDIVGKYKNLMFVVDGTENKFYSDDRGQLIVWDGNLLSYLDFGTITAGQTTDSVRVNLRNMFGYAVNNVKVSVNEDTVTGYEVQIAKDQSFVPNGTDTMQILTYNQTLQDDEEVDFYIRITSDASSAGAGGMFEIVTGADVV